MYEYQSKLKQIHTAKVPCPPINAAAVDISAWRWVRSPITVHCFSPVAIKNPPRMHASTGPSERCACWGISMHSTKDKSIKAFHKLELTVKNARKLFGDHVANASLTSSHGVSTTPSSTSGHFTFHPLKGVQLPSLFVVTQAIP